MRVTDLRPPNPHQGEALTPTLCIRGCTIRGRHIADECTEDCTGCLPARATDGLLVCIRCEKTTREGLRDIAGLWADLGDPRRAPVPRQGGVSDDGPPLLIGDAARDARSAIRACLVAWCHVLNEDYAITYPADTVRAMAHHVAVQAGRLLTSEHADQLVHDVAGISKDAWRLARPAGRRGVYAQCPDCASRVRLEMVHLLNAPCTEMVCRNLDHMADVTCWQCGSSGDLRWWRGQASKVDEPMDAGAVCVWMLENHRLRMTKVQLRQWATRGRVERRGRDEAGRTLYDPIEVASIALRKRERTA